MAGVLILLSGTYSLSQGETPEIDSDESYFSPESCAWHIMQQWNAGPLQVLGGQIGPVGEERPQDRQDHPQNAHLQASVGLFGGGILRPRGDLGNRRKSRRINADGIFGRDRHAKPRCRRMYVMSAHQTWSGAMISRFRNKYGYFRCSSPGCDVFRRGRGYTASSPSFFINRRTRLGFTSI